MSTKIYFAYRMPAGVFSETFLPSFRRHVFQKAADRVKKCMRDLPVPDMRLVYEAGKEYRWPKVSFKKWCEEDKYRLLTVFRNTVAASKAKQRDFDCIDCSLNIWIYKGKVYCILYGECWLWDGYKPPSRVEDYCYWNNTDSPKEVSQRQWKARGDNWDKVCLDGDWNATRMTHDIIHASQEIGLHEVGLHIVDKDAIYVATGV